MSEKECVKDKIICGFCSEEFSQVLPFLQHKIQHVCSGSTLGCDLCQLSFIRQNTLRDHYRRKHKVCLEPRKTNTHNKILTQGTSSDVGCVSESKKVNNEDQKSVESPSCKEDEDSGDNKEGVMSTDISLHDIDGEIDLRSNDKVRNIYITVEPQQTENDEESNKKITYNNFPELLVKNEIIAQETADKTYESRDNASIDKEFEEHCHVAMEAEFESCKTSQIVNTYKKIPENQKALMCSPNDDKVSCEKRNGSATRPKTFKENYIPEALKCGVQAKKRSSTSTPFLKESQEGDYFFILFMEQKQGTSMNYGKMLFKCLHCDYMTDFKASLSRHMKKDHPDMINLHSKIQILMQGSEKDFKDQKVMKMSEYNEMQKEMRQSKTGKRLRGVETQDMVGHFTCETCFKVFNRLRYLRKHVLTHQSKQQHLCDECGKAFKTRAYLASHRKTHKKEAYHCRQCDFVSSVALAIHTHRQIHMDGSVICDICGTAYSDKSTLMKHKQVHDISRPFACTYPSCTFRFKTEIRCQAHIKHHNSTDNRFRCLKCDYTFRYKHHLKRHELKKHSVVNSADKSVQAGSLKSLVIEEIDTANLIVDNDIHSDQFNLQSALQGGLVIATGDEVSAVNYEVADMSMNVQYQTLITSTDMSCEEGTSIMIPHNDCSQVIVHGDNSEIISHSQDIETKTCASVSSE